MIGTQSSMLMIKTDRVMIRVGGGFATLEEHIKQVGRFECIKIYKLMKSGDPTGKTKPHVLADGSIETGQSVWSFK